MNEALARALARVLADVETAGGPAPRGEADYGSGDPREASAMLWTARGTGSRVTILLGTDPEAQVAGVADQLQEWMIEELWAAGRNSAWPVCPIHPDTHPLQARSSDTGAVWICPSTEETTALIGSLDKWNYPS